MITLEQIGGMVTIAVVAMMIVLIAMLLDLVSGLYKAKLRGEIRSSQALKRTITKFITYEGGMMIAVGVDLLIHLSRLMDLFGLDILIGVPVVTCLVGVFLLVVEFLSVREKADQKTKKQMSDAANLLNDMLQNDNLREVFRVAIEHETRVKTEEDAV